LITWKTVDHLENCRSPGKLSITWKTVDHLENCRLPGKLSIKWRTVILSEASRSFIARGGVEGSAVGSSSGNVAQNPTPLHWAGPA
jgi:hypothetical protein